MVIARGSRTEKATKVKSPRVAAAKAVRPGSAAISHVGAAGIRALSPREGLTVELFREFMDEAPVPAFYKDMNGRYLYVNPYMLANYGNRMGSDWYGKAGPDIWPADVSVRVLANDEAVLRDGRVQVYTEEMPTANGPHSVVVMKFPLPTDGPYVGIGAIGVDLTGRTTTEAERDRMAAAIDQATDSIVIADIEGRITYVNPAFERVTGYTADEVMGTEARSLRVGLETQSFETAMWATLSGGQPWVGDLANRRKDGSLFMEEVVITPIRNEANVVTAFVAVKRDVTLERALEVRAVQFARERALIGDTIRGLRAGDAPEATSQAICRQVLKLTGVKAAGLFIFELDGRAMPYGFVIAGRLDPPLRRLPLQRSRHLRKRAADGPWIEPWTPKPTHPYNDLLNGLGVHDVAYAPVRHHGRLIGVLLIDAIGSVGDVAITEEIPALVEFADLAGALIGRDVAESTAVKRARDRIVALIETRAYHTAFQPIVDLANEAGEGCNIVGYEALTRFDDGVAPDVRFAEAAAVGLGPELEAVTCRSAILAAASLPAGPWLNLNVSPGLILVGEPLRTLIRTTDRLLVLEVTEHAAIDDYPAFRAAMAELGPNVELAVDDAGAGFASLRHILELRPKFVKLDRSLVAGLESDTARQAMIVGIGHFARSTECRLVAEGIETKGELAVVRALGIQLGQGYLLGRPMPIGDAATPVPARRADPARKVNGKSPEIRPKAA